MLILVIVIAVFAIGSNGKPAPKHTPAGTTSALPSDTGSPEPSGTDSPAPAPSTVRPPSEVTVVVLNATNVAGLAGKVADKLAAKGYKIVQKGNLQPNADKSAIFYKGGARAEARAMLRAFPELNDIQPMTSSTRKTGLITVVVGADYQTQGSPSPSATP